MTSPTTKDVSSRVAALEVSQQSIQNDLHGLRADFKDFAETVRVEMSRRQRVPWGVLLAGVAGFLGVVAWITEAGSQERHRLESSITAMQSNRFTDRDGGALSQRVRTLESDMATVQDEDFNRPEAEQMKAEIMRELIWLRDKVIDFQQTHGGPPK